MADPRPRLLAPPHQSGIVGHLAEDKIAPVPSTTGSTPVPSTPRPLAVGYRAIAGHDRSGEPGPMLASAPQRPQHVIGRLRVANHHQAHTHIERSKHLVAWDCSAVLQQPENRWRSPRIETNL